MNMAPAWLAVLAEKVQRVRIGEASSQKTPPPLVPAFPESEHLVSLGEESDPQKSPPPRVAEQSLITQFSIVGEA